MRISQGVERGPAITLTIDGATVSAFEGETLAVVMLATGRVAFRRDMRAQPRGLFCNMGTCSECFVRVRTRDGIVRRLRACLTPATEGLAVETDAADD